MVAPRATTKRNKNSSPSTSSGLIFEAADSKAVRTIVAVGVGCCAAEVQVTSIRDTYRATPIVAACAHIAERAIAFTAVTWNGKLQG